MSLVLSALLKVQVSQNPHLPIYAQTLPSRYFGGHVEQYLGNLGALQLVVCHSEAGAPFEPADNGAWWEIHHRSILFY